VAAMPDLVASVSLDLVTVSFPELMLITPDLMVAILARC
jgi:hypothetical protein